jgi:flagellar biosynthetic protein FliO
MARRIPRPAEIALAALLALPLPTFAADPAIPPSLGEASLRTAAALGIVLALIALLAYLFKRFRDSAVLRPSSDRIVSLGRLDLGNRREIRLLEVGGHRLVVGVTGDRIELLRDLGLDLEAALEEDLGPENDGRTLGVLRRMATS